MGLRKVILPFAIGRWTWCGSCGVVPSVTVALNVFLLSQKVGGQAVVPRAWGVSLSAGGGAMQSSQVRHCQTEDSSLPGGSGMSKLLQKGFLTPSYSLSLGVQRNAA